MGQALKQMLKIAPIIKPQKVPIRDMFVRTKMMLGNSDNIDWFNTEVPYIRKINDYISKNGKLSKICFLVTEQDSIARAAATYISANERHIYEESKKRKKAEETEAAEEGYDIELDEYRDYEDVYEEVDMYILESDCYIIDLSKRYEGNTGVDLKYLPYVQYLNGGEKALFEGIDGAIDTDDKLDAFLSCDIIRSFIRISEKQLDEPWLMDIRMNYETDIIYLDTDCQAYYEKLIGQVVKACGKKLSADISETYLLNRLKKAVCADVNENTIAWMLDKALARCTGNVLKKEHFKELKMDEKSSMQILEGLIGLKDLKQKAKEYQALALEKSQNQALGQLHSNMIFYGNPGTGKTTCARLLANILAENGVGSAKFVVCTRSDLIGKYVGHTAPIVAKLFADARGGVMFVDEAGFFLNTDSGGFVDEALKEFVRYMEAYPDVTVIFAMYGREMKEFLELDEGIASRIAEKVYFEDYTIDELWQIFGNMLKDHGYRLSARCKAGFTGYMKAKMNQKDFGNAREARKLAESCIKALSIRKLTEKADNTISLEDMKYAIERNSDKDSNESRQPIGFAANVKR